MTHVLPRIVAFEPLIPAAPGDAPPCRASVVTQAVREDGRVDVTVVDRGIAEQALRSGGWALEMLEAATTGAVQAYGASPGIASWLEARAIARAEGTLRVDGFGELDEALQLNGLAIVDELPGVIERPGVIAWRALDERGLEQALEAWRARAAKAPPDRALAIDVRSGTIFTDARARPLLAAIANGPFRLRSLVWEGAGDALDVVRVLRRLVPVLLRAPAKDAPAFTAGPSASDAVRALAPLVPRIELAAFAALRAHAADDERLRRRLDDVERTMLFRALADARRSVAERARQEPRVLELASARLGPPGAWVRAFRRASEDRAPRLVVIPTWQCELRCRYCTIPKQDGRVMSLATLERTIDLLLSTDAPHVDLHFFGGEPFSEWEILRHAVVWGTERAAREGRTIRFLFTTNGWALTPEQLAFLVQYDVWFQLSLDGDRATHEESRPARDHGSSYDRSPGGKAGFILASKVDHDVVQVVHPRNAERMADNFRHILSLGYRRVQLNYALGVWWEPPSVDAWARGLMEIGREVKARAEAGDPVELVNLEETLLTVRGSLELTIDWDGTVFGSTAFLVLPKKREKFVLGHLDQARSFDHYLHEAFPMEHLLANWFGEGMAENNHAVGAVLTSFVRWWRANVPGVGMRPGRH